MKHLLPALPWSLDALAPLFSAEQLQLHYGKHHRAYVDQLNRLIPGTRFQELTLEEIVTSAGAGPIFNSAAQHWNHSFFWRCFAPGAPRSPGSALTLAIVRDFGSVGELRRLLIEAAVGVFGSGWAWLVSSSDGVLSVQTTADAATPLTAGLRPLLALDVWEHAYYVDYRNERPRYLKALVAALDWEFAGRNYDAPRALPAVGAQVPPPAPPAAVSERRSE